MYTLLLVVLFCMNFFLYSEEKDTLTEKIDAIKSGINTGTTKATDMLTGIAQSVGYCPSGYQHAVRVWNDLSQTITADIQRRREFQGVKISLDTVMSHSIAPYTNSGSLFYTLDICHGWVNLYLGNNSLLSKSFDAIKEKPPVFHYHTFSYRGAARGEFLGPGLTGGPIEATSAFDGVFFNALNKELSLNFIKDNLPYTVSLEPYSFSLLRSTPGQQYSIRPFKTGERTFLFSDGQRTISLPITHEGIARVGEDEAQQKQTFASTYTYCLYNDSTNVWQAEVQGLIAGNYDQVGVEFWQTQKAQAEHRAYDYPLMQRIRDINPVACHFWYHPPLEKEKSTIAITDEQPWIGYATKDQLLVKKLEIDTPTTVHLIRPRLDEKKGTIVVASFRTTDETKIRNFLTRLSKGILSSTTTILDNTLSSLQIQGTSTQKNTLLYDTQGVDASGIAGRVLLIDTFLPWGLSETPLYYGFQTASLQENNTFTALLQTYSDPALLSPDALKEVIFTNIHLWLSSLLSHEKEQHRAETTKDLHDIEAVVPEFTDFFKKHAKATLFSSPITKKELNETGKQILYDLVMGPASLSSLPVLRQAGTSYYFTGKPSVWPVQQER